MLDSEVDSLWDDEGVDALVADDTDGMGGNVEDSAGLSVVELVGHTSVN